MIRWNWFPRRAVVRFLEAIAKGETPDDLLDAMVAAVLDEGVVKLAAEVRAGGQHRWRRAIELAGELVRASSDGTSRSQTPTR